MSENDLIRALESLASEAPRGAPPEVRARTLAAYRAHFRERSWVYQAGIQAAWIGAAAAMIAVALVVPRPVHIAPPAQAADKPSFILLDDEPIGTGQVVRMKLPASTFGETPDAREVEADVLMGEDGLAHAIRLVI